MASKQFIAEDRTISHTDVTVVWIATRCHKTAAEDAAPSALPFSVSFAACSHPPLSHPLLPPLLYSPPTCKSFWGFQSESKMMTCEKRDNAHELFQGVPAAHAVSYSLE